MKGKAATKVAVIVHWTKASKLVCCRTQDDPRVISLTYFYIFSVRMGTALQGVLGNILVRTYCG